MNGQRKQWGLTPSISAEFPTPEDIDQNKELVEELKRENNYEPHGDTQRRMATLKLLNQVNLEFVKDVSRRSGFSRDDIEQFGGRVYPYGSYRLGVFGPGKTLGLITMQ